MNEKLFDKLGDILNPNDTPKTYEQLRDEKFRKLDEQISKIPDIGLRVEIRFALLEYINIL